MAEAKRIVLRIPEPDMNYADMYEPVRLYLSKTGGLLKDLDEGRHFVHVQPPNPDIPQTNPKIHVVVDLEMDKFSGPLGDDFPHEFYRVHREDGELILAQYRESAWLDNFRKKVRMFTDEIYPWGGEICKDEA
ncbi:hypothetical protein N7456_001302 [Penicillium angulare]|uniref:Uncharacterized protein n=1 Tax=Penicillium angulare TaxID=116970 RepID=A0A9W9GDN7_9EURO|nr:hypothetical protein N7456_001302 [Penicillium angulare]